MFHRKRASSNPPPKTPPNAAASTAAAQAFLANRASHANLSSAAAAAALRSRPTTPTAVGDIQTKRRTQRSGSVSSNGSARPGLQRQGSSGSMTERTFRDPSPSRTTTASIYIDDPPPVPSLPKDFVPPPKVPKKSILRPASVEPPSRIKSPPPGAGGRGVSLDRGPGVLPGQLNKAKVATPSPVPNRESVNFSRPMSPSSTPTPSPLKERILRTSALASETGTQQQTKANIGVLRDGEAESIQHSMQETATRPVKKKKKVVAKELAEGSHLPTGGTGERSLGSALETPQRQTPSASSTPSPPKAETGTLGGTTAAQPAPKKKKKKTVSATTSQASYASDSDSAVSDRSFSADKLRPLTSRAAGTLAKQPSIVREDREGEEQEEQRDPGPKVYLKTLAETAINGSANITSTATHGKTPSKHAKSASQPSASTMALGSDALDVPEATPKSGHGKGNSTVQQPRPQSLSPGRAAHFLAQPTYESQDVTKHQPPGRSVSPAKSALKHSPSSRGASPVGSLTSGPKRLSAQMGSEASDTASLRSDEGLKPSSSKKKNIRVSFDEDSVVVGRASTPPAADSPTILSPQHKDAVGKGFLGLGRRKNRASSPDSSDQDIGMEPTPTLPSFGSIRGKIKDGPLPKYSPRGNEGTTHETLSDTQISSDQAVGGILSQELESQRGTSSIKPQRNMDEPLPPEVTSVEGTGYHSDSESSTHSEVGVSSPLKTPSASLPPTTEPTIVQKPSDAKIPKEDTSTETQNGLVPSIAVQPATPGIGTTEEDQEDWFKMPGGFDASNDEPETQAEASTRTEPQREPGATLPAPLSTVEHHATDPTLASLGISEPEPPSPNLQTGPDTPKAGHAAENLQQQDEASSQDESDDTGNSIYSDAAEDMSDFEGDGFGSINAIVDSPTSTKTPFTKKLTQEKASRKTASSKLSRPSPLVKTESEISEPGPEEGWGRAKEYWSGLSHSRKEQLEKAAIPGAVDEASAESTVTVQPTINKPKEKKLAKRTAQGSDPPLPPWPDKEFRKGTTRPVSPKAAGMKQSMRAQPQDDSRQTHMRSSMRDEAPPKSALRDAVNVHKEPKQEPRGPLQKKTRPVSATAMVDHSKAKPQPLVNHDRALSVGVTPKSLAPVAPQPKKASKSTHRRVASTGSDSSSSFKKSRPSTSSGGKYTMRRTMRSTSTDDRPQSANANRTSSLMNTQPTSPAARRPFSSVGPGSGMRTSMRGSMDSGIGSQAKPSSRGFGFGKKGGKSKVTSSRPSSRFSSRFNDSSDDDGGPPPLRSRFADSSDEEEPAPLTPVRGIPRRIDEGDSTDLEDSSAESLPKPKTKPKSKDKPTPPPIQTSTVETPKKEESTKFEGSALATGSLRNGHGQPEMGTGLQAKRATEKEKKKRSFFGSFSSGKKQNQTQPLLQISNPKPVPNPLDPGYVSPASPSSPPTQSPQASKAAASSPTASAQPSPKSPKLQRRHTPKRLASDSWPLPEMPAAAAAAAAGKGRPSTSDGAAAARRAALLRPEAGPRRSTVEGENVNGTGIGVDNKAGGKKKRFPMLRKALGLHD
ncbi:MAG: hypothetical protein Q9167_004134 [Letrouitia subvulpina]